MKQEEAPSHRESGPERAAVLTYLQLRKTVGIIGCSLPFILAFGVLVQGGRLQRSISSYYHTDLGGVFIGSLCAIGLFLASTKGYPGKDEIAGYCAGSLAVATALFPTAPDACATAWDKFIGVLHWSFAALLFLTLAYFCLKLFVKTSGYKKPTAEKLKRNRVYRFCGWTILVCIFCIAISALPPVKDRIECRTLTFWLESAAVVAFGAAWLIKGETFLKDRSV